MILGNIKDIKRYKGMNVNFDSAIDFIENNDIYNLPLGKTEITDSCYANVMDYELEEKESGIFECHRIWADIHLTASGEEAIGLSDLSSLNITEEYIEEKDILFGSTNNFCTYKLDREHFAVVFDDDPHMVKVFTKDKNVRKIVFKFKI